MKFDDCKPVVNATSMDEARKEFRKIHGEPRTPLADSLDDIQIVQAMQASEFQRLKAKVAELEKRLDMHASTQHNMGVDSLKAWRQKGGLAKARTMTAKERSDEMRAAARARWDRRKKPAEEAK